MKQQNFVNVYTSWIHGRYPETMNKLPRMVQVATLSSRQKKDIGEREGPLLERWPKKAQEESVWLLCRLRWVPSSLIHVSSDLKSFASWDREGGSLINWDFLHKWKFSLQKDNFYCFSAVFYCFHYCFLLWLLALKNNEVKINRMSKKLIWGGTFSSTVCAH